MKAPVKNGDPKNYLMDHVSLLYVMGPDGKYITHLRQGLAPDKIAAALTRIVKQGS